MNHVLSNVKPYVIPVLFFLAFCVFLPFITQLRLIHDDNIHLFPALLGNYGDHFSGYIRDFGFTRPFALLTFYIVYTLYFLLPGLPHVLIFLIHVLSGYGLYLVFRRSIPSVLSVLLGLLYVSLPFFTEQYGWLAASNATVATGFLVLQLWVIGMERLGFWKKLAILTVLQFIGVLFYETVFFTFILFVSLLLYKEKLLLFSKRSLSAFLLLSMPSVFYVVMRTVFFVPGNGISGREMSVMALLTPNAPVLLLNNLSEFFASLQFLFLGSGSQAIYWGDNLAFGLFLAGKYPSTVIAGTLSLGILVVLVWQTYAKIFSSQKNQGDLDTTHTHAIVMALQWLLLALCTLLPSILLKQPSFPFRVIALPVFFSIVAVVQYGSIFKWGRVVIHWVLILMIIGGSLVSFSVIQNMRLQYEYDDRAFGIIVESLDQKVASDEEVQVVFRAHPSSTQTFFTYGEYLASCLSADWCAEAALSRRTDKVADVEIDPYAVIEPSDEVVVFGYDPERRTLYLVE